MEKLHFINLSIPFYKKKGRTLEFKNLKKEKFKNIKSQI